MGAFASFAPKDVVSVLPSRTLRAIYRRDKEDKGWLDQYGGVPFKAHGPLPLKEAIEKEWDSDAHIQCFLVEPFDPKDPCYRIIKNSPAQHWIYTKEGWISVFIFCVDLDNPSHAEWTADSWGDFWALLKRLEGTPVWERLKKACVSYSTRKGFRWIFRLSKGVFDSTAEGLLRGLLSELSAGGLLVDRAPVLATWCCTFRLPRVVRDGVKTSSEPFFYCSDVNTDVALDPSSIVPVAGGKEGFDGGDEIPGSYPADSEVERILVHRNDRGTASDTSILKAIKKATHGIDPYPFLFEGKSLEIPDWLKMDFKSRHDMVRRWNYNWAGLLKDRVPEADVTHLYAIFHILGVQFDRSDFRAEVWRMCTGAWRKVLVEKHQEILKEITEIQTAALDVVTGAQRIVQGVLSWHPRLPKDEVKAFAWIQRRMILKDKKRGAFYVMNRDGTYPDECVDETSLIPQIIQQGMEKIDENSQGFIPVTKPTTKGDPVPIRVADLAVAGYITNVSRIELTPEITGGFLKNPMDSTKPVLALPSFRRNPLLVPTYHEGVDEWLTFMGDLEYERLQKHVGCFLAWDKGSCAAISFLLSAGAGKGMFTQGLLECLEDYRNHPAGTASDVVQKFNSRLAITPFIFMNEGIQQEEVHFHASDMFRCVSAGDGIQVEGKHQDSRVYKFGFRVVLTANNWSLIDALGAGRDLAPGDREALGQRLHHYIPRDQKAAARFLSRRGGRKWTRGWVEGEDGKTDFIVAKHFLWLWEQYGKSATVEGSSNRFLIEGDPNQPAIQRLRTKGGSTPIIVEAIITKLLGPPNQVLLGGTTPDYSAGIKIVGGRLWVTVGAILNCWRDNLNKGASERLNANRVLAGLKGLLVDQDAESTDETCWNEIDVPVLVSVGMGYGWQSTRLDKIAADRKSSTIAVATNNIPAHAFALPGGA